MINPQNVYVKKRSIADGVLERLFTAILDGTYGPGARLPAERELVERLGASRVSVREAFRRLQDWRVIISRKGSGATVLPKRFWTSNTMSLVMNHGLSMADWEGLMPIVGDALGMRRSLVLEFMGRAAGRMEKGDLSPAREAVRQAWDVRDDSAAFVIQDREVIPIVLEVAGMYPSLWTINSLAEAYLDVMTTVTLFVPVPESYVPAHLAVFTAQEAGDAQAARAHMKSYLDEVDEGILGSFPEELRARLQLGS